MILKSRSNFTTKLKNLILFPTGLAVADEVCVRGIDHIHAYWLSGSSTVGLIAAQVAGVTWSYSAITDDIFSVDNLISAKMDSASFGRVICERGQRELLRRTPDSGRNRLNLIHLGVEIPKRNDSQFACGSQSPKRIRLLCAAYFIPVKGHIFLVEALREVVDAGIDCHCTFAGEGFLRRLIARKIRDLKLCDNVSMPGVVPHRELLDQLRSGTYDAVVLPSISYGTEAEGIPMSLMEAMAAAIPCISTRTGSIGELIDSNCGILVPERDSRALRDAIITLASYPARRNELGENARRRVASEFDVRNSAHDLARLVRNTERIVEEVHST